MRDLLRNPVASSPSIAALAVAGAAVLVFACRDPDIQGTGCSQDSDCGSPASAFRCETQTGVCYCRTNEACTPREFCNTAGFCQDKSGCEKNEDCIGPDLFCDTSTGSCLSKGRCTTDLHCALGQVCDISRTLCVEGCRFDGDCAGDSCRCGELPCSCTGTTQQELQACQIGVCDRAFCSNESFCKYGDICGIPADAGVQRNQCFSDYDPKRRPYCDVCTFGGGDPLCGSGLNYCLTDTAHPGNFFCGADCSAGQPCPRGYACHDVIVVGLPGTARCLTGSGCAPHPDVPCLADGGCPRGGVCVNGRCAGQCAVDENDPSGFCTCITDDDCPPETCSAGECSVSRRPCVTDDQCSTFHCVDFGGAGGCLIGQNCAPADGLTCLEVDPIPSP
jgi:hypothetical protein